MDLNLAEIIVAGSAALLGWFISSLGYRVTLRQYRLEASIAVSEWLRDVRAWASEAIDVLATASYTVRRGDPDLTNEEIDAIKQCRCRLSALVDRGRLFLPNEQEDRIGSYKPRAYRGFRHPALDSLVAAERILGGDNSIGNFPDRKSALIGMRREFVSTIQAILDPHTSNREIAALIRLASDARAADPTLGGLLPDAKSPPSGAEGVLAIASQRLKAEFR